MAAGNFARRRRTTALTACLVAALVAPAVAPVSGTPRLGTGDTPETAVPAINECFQGFFANEDPGGELYGPTAINAQSANQRLAVAVNDTGTLTTFKWPRPSFYDQIKYRTSDRDAPRLGASANAGAFLGLAITTAGGTRTVWLRTLESSQRYTSQRNDVVETTYRAPHLGLEVVVTGLTVRDSDVHARKVVVHRSKGSPVTDARLISFENLNLVTSKYPYGPVQDWCFEFGNRDHARYDEDLDAIVHTRRGVDRSTGKAQRVAVAMAFDDASHGHQVGGDAYEGTSLRLGELPAATQGAYDDAADGRLRGNDAFPLPGAARPYGQTTGAMARKLDLSDGTAAATVYLAAAETHAQVASALRDVRDRPFARLVRMKRRWFTNLLAKAPLPDLHTTGMPDEAKKDILATARRALVTLVSVYDPKSGAIVASIATQSPYGEDWIRDGAFFNRVLNLIGMHDWVANRNRWYAGLQSSYTDPVGGNNPFAEFFESTMVPPGNWAMNYYADGVVGGPIPFEVDETGYGIWTLWNHYAVTGNERYLRDVYPAIRRAARYLTEVCVDRVPPATGLHCTSFEDDNPVPKQTINGAGPVFLGLDSAVRAAKALGRGQDVASWRARRSRLRQAVENQLYRDGSYGGGNGVIVWPACFHPYDHPRFTGGQYDAIRDRLRSTFREPRPGPPHSGLYESKGLLALAKATKGKDSYTRYVRNGLSWIAGEHAEPGTHVMGEEWLSVDTDGDGQRDDEVTSIVSQPHVWEQVLFYLAALEAWPPNGFGGAEHRGCAGTVGAIMQARTHGPR